MESRHVVYDAGILTLHLSEISYLTRVSDPLATPHIYFAAMCALQEFLKHFKL